MFYYKYTVETLHSPYTSDKCMRAGILMAVFKVNMSTPAHWYHLDVKAEMEGPRLYPSLPPLQLVLRGADRFSAK